MNKKFKAVFGVFAFLLAQSSIACDYPTRVLIPNGNTATKEDMTEGRQGVQKYVADMQTYLDCVVAEEKAERNKLDNLAPEQEQEREDMLNKKYNAAVDEMERLAAQFNSELQAYNSQNEG